MQITPELDVSDFGKATYEAWRALAEADLKGAPFDKKLVTHTYEGIDIQPIYTESDLPSGDASGFPGLLPMTRGSVPAGASVCGWNVAQEHLHPDPATTNKAILEDLMRGAHSVVIRFDDAAARGDDADAADVADHAGRHGVMLYTLGDIRKALAEVKLDIAPVMIETGGAFVAQAAILAARQRETNTSATAVGYFGADPLAALARSGEIPRSVDQALKLLADMAAWTKAHRPKCRAVTVSTSPYHDGGATAAQDLAFSMATGLEYVRAMTDGGAGLSVDDACGQMVFSYSVGTNFFLAIAKLRAARKLWAKVATTAGASEKGAAMLMHVRTSRRVLTQRDPWVNLLRNTVCCFAGAVSGAQVITTEPFDAAIGLPSDFSRRIARNTQTILMEESNLPKVIDPAGGCYFLEKLTDELCEKAWEIFRQVEAQGGMSAALVSGWVNREIDSAFAPRAKNLARRKDAITGVSEFPNLTEEKVTTTPVDYSALRAEASLRLRDWRAGHSQATFALEKLRGAVREQLGVSGGAGEVMEHAVRAAVAGATVGQVSAALLTGQEPTHAAAVALHPFAEPFEQLRDASDAYLAKTGSRPKVFLANVGPVAHTIARATYAKNFFEAGGFEAISSEPLKDGDAAAAAAAKVGANIVVLCSSDKLYPTVVPDAVPKLKAGGKARTVILAGNPGAAEADYKKAGVDRFIFMGCAVLDVLKQLQKEEGVL